jgi:hypothetical protein
MLFTRIKEWAPFHIDALGLVTILGVTEVDYAVGRLVQSYFTDCLPLLGAYTIASNQVTEPIPGFVLYNITDGIVATDLTGWFTRWLLCTSLSYTSTTITISKCDKPRSSEWYMTAYLLGILTMSPIAFFAAAMGDWWGLVNSLSMAASVLVRKAILGQNRRTLDLAATKSKEHPDDIVKVFLTMPSGKAVSIHAPRLIVIDCLLTTPRPPHSWFYNGMRALGWVAFGSQIISLGMATLFNQLLSVCLMLVATLLVVLQVGDSRENIGLHLSFKISNAKGGEFRAAAYARFKLSEQEENSMIQWNLFPHKSNERWWTKYRQASVGTEESRFHDWNEVLPSSNPKLPESMKTPLTTKDS